MSDLVISQAENWGFICQTQQSNRWQILPLEANQRWKLEKVEDRWILIVGDVPQLRLQTEEAIAFLENHRFQS